MKFIKCLVKSECCHINYGENIKKKTMNNRSIRLIHGLFCYPKTLSNASQIACNSSGVDVTCMLTEIKRIVKEHDQLMSLQVENRTKAQSVVEPVVTNDELISLWNKLAKSESPLIDLAETFKSKGFHIPRGFEVEEKP